jgi:hypothetical protein
MAWHLSQLWHDTSHLWQRPNHLSCDEMINCLSYGTAFNHQHYDRAMSCHTIIQINVKKRDYNNEMQIIFLCLKYTSYTLRDITSKIHFLITKILSFFTNSTFKQEWNYMTAVTTQWDPYGHSDLSHSLYNWPNKVVDHLILPTLVPTAGSWPIWTGIRYTDRCKIN